MWYKAASVIAAILHCDRLSVEKNTHTPSCPKEGNNIHCLSDFPLCEGKTKRCQQSLRVINESGNPLILYFDYYLSHDDRDGRIKKQNSTLRLLMQKYNIDEAMMVSA